MIVWKMIRGSACVADVVTLPNGRCVVSWPTSTIVYDSELAMRRVHIDHMKGRGEETDLLFQWSPNAVGRGWDDCYQDRCEGIGLRIWDGSTLNVPDYVVGEVNRADYALGYEACAYSLYGTEWRDFPVNGPGQHAALGGEEGA